MLIICDTSPITNLIQLSQLDLLHRLFGEIIIPDKVFEELAIYENQGSEITARSWISVKAVKDRAAVKALENQLDPGEAEAIILAKEMRADLLIVDERKGRKIAKAHGLASSVYSVCLSKGRRRGISGS